MDKRNPLESIGIIIKAVFCSCMKKNICSRGTSFVCCVADNVFLNSRCKDRTRCMMSEWDYVKELTRDMADQFVGPTIYIRPRNFYFNKDNTDNIHLATFMCAARQDFDDIAFYKLVSTEMLLFSRFDFDTWHVFFVLKLRSKMFVRIFSVCDPLIEQVSLHGQSLCKNLAREWGGGGGGGCE